MLSRQRTTVAAATALAGLLLALTPAVAHSTTPTTAPASTATPSISGYCGYYRGKATTQYGDYGDRVREIQCTINAWAGGEMLAVNGAFGPRTQSWVVHFQDMMDLPTDGIVGPETWNALRAV